MPAGKYYVGDLCYVMHPQWDEFCDITIKDKECYDGEFNLKNGVKFASYGTAWGDGVYFDQEGREYGVDAGLIGCILLSDIDDPEANPEDCGQIIDFETPFETSYSEGVIYIGHIKINTDESEDFDDEIDNDDV